MTLRIDRPRALASGIFILAFSLFALTLAWTDFDAHPNANLFVGLLAFVTGISGALAARPSRQGPTPYQPPRAWPLQTRQAAAGGVFAIALGLFLLVLALGDFDTHPGTGMLAALLAFIGGISMASMIYWNQIANVRHH